MTDTVPTPRELQGAAMAGLLGPHERLSEISPGRARELGRQMLDMGMEPADDCARIAGAFMEQVSYDLESMIPGFDRARQGVPSVIKG